MQIAITPITREQTADYYELGPITDNREARSVSASVTTVFGPIQLTLWEGEDYDNIGQWTDSGAEARIAELLAARYAPTAE